MVWMLTRGIWQIFISVHGSLKIETYIVSFYSKYTIYELKTYTGVMCYDNET